jgi:3-hydroxyacyl-CoA dehydrogenase
LKDLFKIKLDFKVNQININENFIENKKNETIKNYIENKKNETIDYNIENKKNEIIKNYKENKKNETIDYIENQKNEIIKNKRIENYEKKNNFKEISLSQLLIENINDENIEIKKKLIKDSQEINPNIIIGLNTINTNISITSIISNNTDINKKNIIGLNFFDKKFKNVKLVEIVKTKYTSDNTIFKVYNFCLKLNKIPVVIHEFLEFNSLVKRFFSVFLFECLVLWFESFDFYFIDEKIENFGFLKGKKKN